MYPLRHIFSLLSFFIFLTACDKIEDYQTDSTSYYSGRVIGSHEKKDCSLKSDCSSFQEGFSPKATLKLEYFPNAEETVGFITTNKNECGQVFNQTPLKKIKVLERDALSLYALPGEEHLKNYIYAATPKDGPKKGKTFTVFLSLMNSGNIEVRLLSSSGENHCTLETCMDENKNCDYFGIFKLEKRHEDPIH